MGTEFWGSGANPGTGTEEDPSQLGPWDRITLAGVILPGSAQLEGDGAAISLDVKRTPGTSGARLTFLGTEPSKILIKLRIWTPGQLAAFDALLPKILPTKAGGAPNPVDVSYPSLAQFKIRRIYIQHVGLLVEGSTKGVRECRIQAIQYRKLTKANVNTPTASAANVADSYAPAPELAAVPLVPSAAGAANP